MDQNSAAEKIVEQTKLGAAPAASRTVSLGAGWMTAPVEQLALYSPLLALARKKGTAFQPYILPIAFTFTQGGPTISQYISWNSAGAGSKATADQFMVVDRVMIAMTAPNLGDGAFLKPLNDFFFERESGIEATMDTLGRPQYAVAPFFVPIQDLTALLTEAWPMGWVLQYTQAVRMQFQQQVPLPTFPVTVKVSFRMWTPAGARFRQMSEYQAAQELVAMGIDCGTGDWSEY